MGDKQMTVKCRKLTAKFIIVLFIFNLLSISALADDTYWVVDKPARLVSYKYHDESECFTCGKHFEYEFEYVLDTELNGRTVSGPPHGYAGDGHDTQYDCTGTYYCVSHKEVAYQEYINNKPYEILYYPEDVVKHLQSHGLDQNGDSAVLVFGDSCDATYYYGEQYKEAEGHYEKIADSSSNNKANKTAATSNSTKYKNNTRVVKKSLFGVALRTVKKGNRSFTARWKKATKRQQKKFSGYQIQYSTSKDFSKHVKTKSTTKRSASKVVIRKLKKKTTYYVRMRRFKKVGKKKIYSAWSKVKKVKTK